MSRSSFFCLLFLAPAFVIAQKKSFTHRQLFGQNYPAGVFNPLPKVEGWIDDDHYIESRDSNGTEVLVSVEVRTGKTTPYTPPSGNATDSNIRDARNLTTSPDGRYIAYTKTDNNLYVTETATGKETALTSDGSDVILNGYASWIYYEEILGRSSRYKAFWWSPDSKHIAFMRFDDTRVPVFPIYVADEQHGYLEQQHYPKAGDPNPEVRIGITPVSNKSTVWADFNPALDQYFGTPYWTPENNLWVQWMNRDQDSLVVYSVDPRSGSPKQVYTETQSTWVTLDDADRFSFLPANQGVIIKSDKDGWENLYLYSADGRQISQITSGNFWGTSILYTDTKNKQVFLRARKDNSARFDVFKASFNGKSITRLSSGKFSHDAVIVSPNGKYMITVYSSLATPPVMTVMDNQGKMIREIGNTRGAAFDQYALPSTTLLTVKSDDGLFDLPLTITYPINFDSTKKYPVWISIYGGPNAGAVFDRWRMSGGFNQWWAQEGIIQVSMDNRSSGHFGKKGLNYIYKHLGKYEVDDYMSCAKWLRSRSWVDSARIGITGGSFGGYITCMALTYGADVFTHGIANYSVTDWQLYDSHYTERFMNTPKQNPQGYKSTSAMTYAGKYRGMLRIVHGTTDDNVHMQNSVQLIDTLQDLNRNFEMMIYPNQRHGIGGTKAAHNLRESARFIYRYMLGRELPKEFGN